METPDLGVGDAGAETVLGQDGWWSHGNVFTWRKARFDGAMVAFVNRQEDAQVRQVGASDPEQQHAFSKGGRIYVMVIRTGPSTSYDDDYVDSPRLQ